MRQTTWTSVYFIAQLFYFIALVRTALLQPVRSVCVSLSAFFIWYCYNLRKWPYVWHRTGHAS